MKELVIRQLYDVGVNGIPNREQHQFVQHLKQYLYRARNGGWSCTSSAFKSFKIVINQGEGVQPTQPEWYMDSEIPF